MCVCVCGVRVSVGRGWCVCVCVCGGGVGREWCVCGGEVPLSSSVVTSSFCPLKQAHYIVSNSTCIQKHYYSTTYSILPCKLG